MARCAALRGAESANRHRLQPMDPDRLLVPRLVQKADADEIAGLQHLPRRLRKARLVPVDRRYRSEPRCVQHQAEKAQQRHRPDACSLPRPTPGIGPLRQFGGRRRAERGGRGHPLRSGRFDASELRHRRRSAATNDVSPRLRTADGNSGQRAAMPRMPFEQPGLALGRHDVGDEAAAGRQDAQLLPANRRSRCRRR